MSLNNNIYTLNFKKLVVWLLPTPLRKPVKVAWLMVLIHQVIKLYNELLAFRTSVLYMLTITPQVCKLEKMLNDRYDNALRRIYITDAKQADPIFLYQKVENKPTFFFQKSENKPIFLYTKAETAKFGVDFIIRVPVFVVFDINELSSLVKRFKLASKTFKVQIV